jgi:hypothetical protein
MLAGALTGSAGCEMQRGNNAAKKNQEHQKHYAYF